MINFLLLLLPGYIALNVYRPFVFESDRDDSDKTLLIKSLAFGLPGFLVTQAVNCHIAWQFFIALLVSLLFAVAFGITRRKYPNVEGIFERIYSKNKDICAYPQKSALEFADEVIYADSPSDVAVIAIKSGEILGELIQNCNDGKEMTLKVIPHITIDFIEQNRNDNTAACTKHIKIVNLNGIIEFVEIDREKINSLYY